MLQTMSKAVLYRLFVSATLVLSLFLTSAQAEDKIQVKLRLLQASEKSMLGFSSFVTDAEVDPQLTDLREQLNVLPFEHFKVLNTEQLSISIRKKTAFTLSNGHKIVLKPLSVEGEQVSLWLKWKDETDQCLLDTRMHFDSSQAMLAGTDHNKDDGLLLAINVKALAKE